MICAGADPSSAPSPALRGAPDRIDARVMRIQMPIQALIPVAEGEESEYNVLRAWRTPQAATLSLMARAAGLPGEAG